MRANTRIWLDPENVNTGLADHPLKGLLRDKGVADAEQCIRIVQRKVVALSEAMEALVTYQRNNARNAGCECIDLYLETTERQDRLIVDYTGREALQHLAISELKSRCVLNWRARAAFATANGLSKTGRVHPFDADHKTYAMVDGYVKKISPGFYKVLAAYETMRNTLNYTMKAYRKVVLDLHRIRVEADGLPHSIFDRETAKLSQQFLAEIDPTGEVSRILEGVYGDTTAQNEQ